MGEEKITNSTAIGLRRAEELRELAPAAFCPATHSGDAARLKRIQNSTPTSAVPPPLRRSPPDLGLNSVESVAKPR